MRTPALTHLRRASLSRVGMMLVVALAAHDGKVVWLLEAKILVGLVVNLKVPRLQAASAAFVTCGFKGFLSDGTPLWRAKVFLVLAVRPMWMVADVPPHVGAPLFAIPLFLGLRRLQFCKSSVAFLLRL